MPDTTTKLTYSKLIENAINDFDSIYTQLQSKKVLVNDIPINKDQMSDGTIPTSMYASLIAQLWKIKDVTSPTISDGVVPSFLTENSLQFKNINITSDGSTVKIPLTLSAAGYYDTTATGEITLNAIAAEFKTAGDTTFEVNETVKDGYYRMLPLNNSIFGTVDIKKGSVSLDASKATVSTVGTHTVTSTLDYENVTGKDATLELFESEPTEGVGKLLKVSVTPSFSGTTTVEASDAVVVENGYVTGRTNTKINSDFTTGALTGAAKDFFINLPLASISGEKTVNATVENNSSVILNASETGSYKISVTSNASANNIQVTPGYINDAATQVSLGEDASLTTKLFIKAGNLGTAADNAKDISESITLGKPVLDSTNKKYTVSVNVADDYTKAVTDGYIPESGKTFAATITGSKTLDLAQGAAAVSYASGKTPSLIVTDEADLPTGISTTGTAADVKVSLAATAEFTKSSTAGYIAADGSDVTAPENINLTKDVYIKKATLSHSTSITSKSVDGKTEEQLELFTQTKPANNYYEVTATDSISLTQAGYIDSIGTVAEKKLYMPKAVFEYVEDSTAGNFIQVKSGGYIQSGEIAQISDIGGTLDEAIVGAVAKINEASGVVTVSKNDATTNAGYYGSGKGTFTCDSLNLGIAVLTPSVTGSDFTLGAPVKSGEGVNTKYTFSGKTTAKASAKVTEKGYAPLNTTTAADATQDINATLELAEAQLQISSGEIEFGASSSSVKISTSATDYAIKPAIKAGALTIGAKTAGYLDTVSTQTLTPTIADGQADIYIQAATIGAATNTLNATPTLRGASTDTNTYVVNLIGVASGTDVALKANSSVTIGEGYYKHGDAIVASANITATALTIDAATAKATASITNSSLALNSADDTDIKGVLTTSNVTATGYRFAKITNIINGTANATVNKEGYLKSDSQINGGTTEKTFENYYIKVVTTNSFSTASNATVVDVEGVEKFVGTENASGSGFVGAVNENEPICNINADTMGTGIANELNKLMNRLAGKATA